MVGRCRRGARRHASLDRRRTELIAANSCCRRGEAQRLAKHRLQALEYWIDSSDAEKGVEAPRFGVLCAFRNYTRSSTRRSRPPTAGPARVAHDTDETNRRLLELNRAGPQETG